MLSSETPVSAPYVLVDGSSRLSEMEYEKIMFCSSPSSPSIFFASGK